MKWLRYQLLRIAHGVPQKDYDELQKDYDALLDKECTPKIVDLHLSQLQVSATLEHPMFAVIAQLMHKLFINCGGKNFVAITLQRRPTSEVDEDLACVDYDLILQKSDGIPIADELGRLQRENDKLQKDHDELLNVVCRLLKREIDSMKADYAVKGEKP